MEKLNVYDQDQDIIDTDKLQRILYKIGYNGFWVLLALRFVGIAYSYYLFRNQNYIAFVLVLIVSIPSFDYTMTYIKHINKLFNL